MPFREVTITLDNVSYLLHLSVTGKLIDYIPLLFGKKVVKILLMTHLGILTEIKATTTTNAGVRVRLTWLEDLYRRYLSQTPVFGIP